MLFVESTICSPLPAVALTLTPETTLTYYSGDVVELQCEAGFTGQISIVCTKLGIWSRLEGACQRKWRRLLVSHSVIV